MKKSWDQVFKQKEVLCSVGFLFIIIYYLLFIYYSGDALHL